MEKLDIKKIAEKNLKSKKEKKRQNFNAVYEELGDNLYIKVTDKKENKRYIYLTDIDMKPLINFLKDNGYFETISSKYLQFECPIELAKSGNNLKYLKLHHLVILYKLLNAKLNFTDLRIANKKRSKISSGNLDIDHITEIKIPLEIRDTTSYENELLPQANNRFDNLVFINKSTNSSIKTEVIDKILCNYSYIDHYNNKFYIKYYLFHCIEIEPNKFTCIVTIEYDLPNADNLEEKIKKQAEFFEKIYREHYKSAQKFKKFWENNDVNNIINTFYNLIENKHIYYILKENMNNNFLNTYLNKLPYIDINSNEIKEIKNWKNWHK